MVGHQTLNLAIGVRVPASQPIKSNKLRADPPIAPDRARLGRAREMLHYAGTRGASWPLLRTVVCSELEGIAAMSGYLFKLAHHPLGCQAKIHRRMI